MADKPSSFAERFAKKKEAEAAAAAAVNNVVVKENPLPKKEDNQAVENSQAAGGKSFAASVRGNRPSSAGNVNKNNIYLVRGKDKGRPAWHYVLVDPLKVPLFLKDVNGPSIDVANYGKILESGWDEPSDEIKAKYENY